jgi:hypothetical protein
VAAAGTTYGVVSGQEQQSAQQAALKKQNTAQQQATGAALSTQRNSEVAQGAANQQTPDITSILARAATQGKGSSSTMLTGPGGVDNSALNLGKQTLLGA